jgi:hypothetical protein
MFSSILLVVSQEFVAGIFLVPHVRLSVIHIN